MINEKEIEKKWELSKLLVTNLSSYKLFLFKLPQYGLYLQSLRPIPLTYLKRPKGVTLLFYKARMPHIAAVRSLCPEYVSEFIQNEPEFQVMKIFKHGLYFKELTDECVGGLAKNTTKNMMALKLGKAFRIVSTSKELRDLFYENALMINEEEGYGCKFDYDEYDYTLEIRPYKRFRNDEFYCWGVVTILYGEDMPNHYNM